MKKKLTHKNETLEIILTAATGENEPLLLGENHLDKALWERRTAQLQKNDVQILKELYPVVCANLKESQKKLHKANKRFLRSRIDDTELFEAQYELDVWEQWRAAFYEAMYRKFTAPKTSLRDDA